MTAQEFVNNYYLHDSLFNEVSFSKGEAIVTMLIDFAFWMQPWYRDDLPETGLIKVSFCNVEDCNIPDDVEWDQISILQAEVSDGLVKFALMNDMDDSYLDMTVASDCIKVETDIPT